MDYSAQSPKRTRARRKTRDLASRTAFFDMPSDAATAPVSSPATTVRQKASQVRGSNSARTASSARWNKAFAWARSSSSRRRLGEMFGELAEPPQGLRAALRLLATVARTEVVQNLVPGDHPEPAAKPSLTGLAAKIGNPLQGGRKDLLKHVGRVFRRQLVAAAPIVDQRAVEANQLPPGLRLLRLQPVHEVRTSRIRQLGSRAGRAIIVAHGTRRD